MTPRHLKVDVWLSGLRAVASHVSECPELGPICALRAEPPQEHHTTLWLSELRVFAEYGLLDALAVQAMFPLRLADSRTEYADLDGRPVTLDYQNIHHRDGLRFGPSDPQLLVHLARAFGAIALGARIGFSVPLGVVNANPYRLGEQGLPHEHMQFGTGSFDPVLSVDATARLGPLSASVFAYTQVPLYAGRNGYQAGTRLVGGFTFSAPLGDATLRASLLGLNEWAERWDGLVPLEDGNQGRADLYLGTGITVPFAEDWTVSFDVRGRLWGVAKNAQLDLPLVVEVSVGRLFHLEDGEHGDHGGHDEHAEHAEHAEHEATADVLDVVVSGEAAPLVAKPGAWTVFDFWAPWCEACRVLDKKLRDRSELALRRVNIVDFDSPIAQQELKGVSLLPHVRLVGPDGRVAYEASGPPDELLRGIDAAMSR